MTCPLVGAIPTAHEVLITAAEQPLTLSTARGYLMFDMVTVQHIGAFGEEVNPFVLASTQMCFRYETGVSENGFELHWAPRSEVPAMTRPSGHVNDLEVRN